MEGIVYIHNQVGIALAKREQQVDELTKRVEELTKELESVKNRATLNETEQASRKANPRPATRKRPAT